MVRKLCLQSFNQSVSSESDPECVHICTVHVASLNVGLFMQCKCFTVHKLKFRHTWYLPLWFDLYILVRGIVLLGITVDPCCQRVELTTDWKGTKEFVYFFWEGTKNV
jgi:hypothetical protein